MISRFLSAALVLVAALPALAAEDVPLPPLTPKGEYLVMTQDDATSSSKCVNNLTTPMCAVETELACRSRAVFKLCLIARGLATDGDIVAGSFHHRILYRVVRREVLDDRHFPWKPYDLPWRRGESSVQAGDVRIDIRYGDCFRDASPRSCQPFYTTIYVVRRQDGRWIVVAGREPQQPPKGKFLVVTKDDTTTSSKCIGNPETPLCAVETELACRVRANFELCRIGMGLDTDENINKGPPRHPTLYRVTRQEVLDDRHFPWSPTRDLPWRPGEISMRAGDVRIDLLYGECPWDISPSSCHPVFTMAYIVRRQGDRWAVIEAGDPTNPRLQ